MKRALTVFVVTSALSTLLVLAGSLLAAAKAPTKQDEQDQAAAGDKPAGGEASQTTTQPAPETQTQTEAQTTPEATTPAPREPSGETAPAKPAPAARAAGSGSVTIRDFAFAPKSLTVHVGDRVSWFNQGPAGHSATADDGSFDTGVLAKGRSGSFSFTRAGTFSYHCTPHPFMKASITVVAAGASGGGSGASSSGSTSGESGAGANSSSSPAGGGSPSLPSTGLDAAVVAAVGLAFLGLGAHLRRRAAPDS